MTSLTPSHKFAELRTPQVLLSSAFDQEVCISRYREIIDLVLHGLSRLANLNAFQMKKLLHRQYAVLTLACALTGFVVSVELTGHLFEGLVGSDSMSYYQQARRRGGSRGSNEPLWWSIMED